MATSKQKYFDKLRKFEQIELFITDRTDIINEEIYHNYIRIGMTNNLAIEITTQEILRFLKNVKLDRQLQLMATNLEIDLIYYLWMDEMAGQLRFNFINSNHEKLPFGCNLNVVETETEIIDSFLCSKYLEGIPFAELEDVGPESTALETEEKEIYTLNIYKQRITRPEDV